MHKMTIVDRYLFFLFIKTFLVCFLSFAGLFVIVHLFSNLDELTEISKTTGWGNLFFEFYIPRIYQMFDKTAGILMLVSAIFSVSLLQRRREMTAIEAAGITKSRILRPIFLTAIVIIGLSIANREILIPNVKESLVRTPQTWGDKGQMDVAVQEDLENGVVLRGDQLFLGERRVSEADIQLPGKLGTLIPRIHATWGILEPANEMHPAGLWMHAVDSPKDIAAYNSLQSPTGETIFFSQKDNPWLGRGQCFVACNFTVEKMAYGKKLNEYATTPEMMAELRKPKKWFGNGQQANIHSRLLKPILDMTLLMLGLPMVIGGTERNVFISAGIGFWIVGAIQLTTITCTTLGATSIIRPAALAAWIPVLIFLPFAVLAMRRLKS